MPYNKPNMISVEEAARFVKGALRNYYFSRVKNYGLDYANPEHRDYSNFDFFQKTLKEIFDECNSLTHDLEERPSFKLLLATGIDVHLAKSICSRTYQILLDCVTANYPNETMDTLDCSLFDMCGDYDVIVSLWVD
jgi:hypothetical protein